MGLLNVRRTAHGVFPLITTRNRPIYVLSTSYTRVKNRLRCGTAGSCNAVVTMTTRLQTHKMKILPDPRRYAATSSNSLLAIALEPTSASQHTAPEKMIVAAMTRALQAGDDAQVDQALAQAPSFAVRRALGRALDEALRTPDDSALQWRFFSIPLLIVTGGLASATVAGAVPDAAALTALFEKHGALGAQKNFALGNALVSVEGMAGLKPGVLWRLARSANGESSAQLDLAPAPIQIASAAEQVHLRFLNGVSVTAPDAPVFTETAGNIAAWGMPFTRELAAQLGQQGLSFLPIPRPPMAPLRAIEAGLFSHSELGLQLFLSDALRKFRARVGEARATVASHTDGTVRTGLSSPFDASLSAEYAWKLQPGDDMAAVANSIFSLLEECRVMDVEVAEGVQVASH